MEKELSNLRFRQVLEGLTEGQMMAWPLTEF